MSRAALIRPIVVGVDLSTPSEDATLDWACREATTRNLPLWVVLGRPVTPDPPGGRAARPEGAGAGAGVSVRGSLTARDVYVAKGELDMLVRTLQDRYAGLDVTGRVVVGNWAEAMLSVARVAESLVVGAGTPSSDPTRDRALAAAVVDRAGAPVVVCSGRREPQEGRDAVVVGLTPDLEPHAVLAFAFEHARGHQAPVRIHLRHNPGVDPALTQDKLDELVSIWAQIYPDVPLESQVVPTDLAGSLLGAADRARLVVVGHRAGSEGSPQRGVDPQLLRWCRTPVAVVPLPRVG